MRLVHHDPVGTAGARPKILESRQEPREKGGTLVEPQAQEVHHHVAIRLLQPRTEDIRDARTLRKLRQAVLKRAAAESQIAELVTVARDEGQAWSAIGAMLGTSGEAARQRYGGYREGQSEGGARGLPTKGSRARASGNTKSGTRKAKRARSRRR